MNRQDDQKAVVKASELQRASGKVLRRVAVDKEHLVVERDGYPVAVIMSYPVYEAPMRERALAAHRELVPALGKEAKRQGLTEEQLIVRIQHIVEMRVRRPSGMQAFELLQDRQRTRFLGIVPNFELTPVGIGAMGNGSGNWSAQQVGKRETCLSL